MASEVGVAYLTVLPSARGFGASLQRQVGPDMARTSRAMGTASGRDYGRSFSTGMRGIIGAGLGTALAYGAARVVKESVNLEATFSRTMNRIAAATKVPRSEMETLERLAMRLGAETTFSANEVSEAMLGLAKGGLTQAQIRAGALADTLTLAAAGDMELKEAADATVASMGAFNLTGRQTGRVASALAGAANASAADVSDLTQALSQAGTEANSVGFSVEDTTAALAAFSNAGIQGSDAGTSLRTFLQRLVPTTTEARDAMSAYGLTTYSAARATKILAQDGIDTVSSSYEDVSKAVGKYLVQQGVAEEGTVALEDATRKYLEVTGIMHSDFTKQNGEFKSLAAISGELKKSLEDLPPAERSAALSAIFGSDARRAANILVDEGTDGIRKYIKATSDLNAAEKMAGAATRGTAGALERLDGATETAMLKIGRGLAPTVQDASHGLADFLDTAPLERWARNFGTAARDVWREVRPLGADLMELGQDAWPLFIESAKLSKEVLETMLPLVRGIVKAFNSLPDAVQQALILGVAAHRLTRAGTLGGALLGRTALMGAGAAAAGGAVAGGAATGVAGAGAAAAGGAAAGRFARFRGGARSTGMAALALYGGQATVSYIQDLGQEAPRITALGNALRNMGTFGAGRLPGEMEDLSDSVERLTSDSMAHRLERWAGSYDQEAEEVRNLDNAFMRLAKERGLPAARRAFQQMAESEDLTREETKALMSILPGYRRLVNGASDATDNHAKELKGAREAGWDLLGLWRRNLLPTTKDLSDKFGMTSKEAGLLRGVLGDTTQTGKRHEAQLRQVAKQLGLNREETQELIDKYGDIPKRVETRAEFLTAEAERKRDAFLRATKGKFSDLGNETYAIMVNGQSGHGRIFAEGGFVSGPGGPRDDKISARLSNGEFVVNAAATRANRDLLEQMNARRFADGGYVGKVNTKVQADFSRLREIVQETIRSLQVSGATGGLTPAQVARGQAFARSQIGDPYVWGGVGPNGYDCSGFMSAVFNAARGSSPYSRLGSTGTMPWPSMREGRGGAFRVGWFTGNPGHTAGTIGGLNVESRGGEGVVVGRNARGADDPLFNRHGYFVTAAGARIPVGMGSDPASTKAAGGPLNRYERYIVSHESGGSVRANNPASTAFGLGQLLEDNRMKYARQLGLAWRQEAGDTGTTNRDAQLAMMRAYIKDRYGTPAAAYNWHVNHGWYDNGGVLKPGWTAAYNGTGRDEYVTKEKPRQGVQRFVLDAGGGRTLTGWIDDGVDASAEFAATTTRMRR